MTLILLILLLTISAQVVLGSETSWNGNISINYKDSNVQVGKDLKLNCTASKEVAKASDFDVKKMFLKAGEGKKMDGVKILSEVSIGFEETAKFGSPPFYTCWFNDTLIADINISYGAPPPEPVVEKFIILNWEKVELTLGPTPQLVSNITGEDFYPDIDIRYSFLNCSECGNECTDVKNLEYSNWHKCSVVGVRKCETDDYKHHSTDFWYFSVWYSNNFGNSCALFNMTTADAIKPDPVEGVSVSVLNSTTVNVTLEQTSKCKDYPCLYNITLKAMNLKHEISFITTLPAYPPLPVTESGLYPHGNYTILVTASPEHGGLSSDVRLAENILLWEDVPAANPAFIPGAIKYYKEVDGKQDVRIYWQEIPEKYKNGYITKQILEVHQGISADGKVILKKQMNSKQLMEKLSLKSGEDYTITLSAATKNGTNTTLRPSILPIKGKVDDELCVVTNVVAVHIKDTRRVNVSWENCDKRAISQNVVYMCQKKRDEKECEGPLNWTPVPPNVSQKMIDLPGDDQYRIGVANIVGNSSRMVWSPCLFKQGAEPSEGPQGSLKQNGVDIIEYKLDSYYCRENTGIVESLKFIYCESEEDGSCLEQQKTLTKPMPANYMHRGATFRLPVEEGNHMYSVNVLAKSDGGEKPWQEDVIVDMQDLDGPTQPLYLLYLMIIPVLLFVVLAIFLVRRYYFGVIGEKLHVKLPEFVGQVERLDERSYEPEHIYEEIKSDNDLAITSDVNIDINPAVRQKHPSSNSSGSTAETSLSDNVPAISPPSNNDSSGLGSSLAYDTSGSAMSYAKVTLTDSSEPAEAAVLNVDNSIESSDAAILDLDINGGRSGPGYEKLNATKRVSNPYDKLITSPVGHVLPVLRDDLHVPDSRSKHISSDLGVDKSSKGSFGKDAVKDDLITGDSSVQSGVDTTSDSDMNISSSDNTGNSYKNVPPTILNRLLTGIDPSSSSGGSNTDFTGGSTSQGSSQSNSNATPNHEYRDNLQGSADSYDSNLGNNCGSAESNQDYRRAGPEASDEACGRMFEHMRLDTSQESVLDESSESQS